MLPSTVNGILNIFKRATCKIKNVKKSKYSFKNGVPFFKTTVYTALQQVNKCFNTNLVKKKHLKSFKISGMCVKEWHLHPTHEVYCVTHNFLNSVINTR